MAVYLCNKTALEFWRVASWAESDSLERSLGSSLFGFYSCDPQAASNLISGSSPLPAHLQATSRDETTARVLHERWGLTAPFSILAAGRDSRERRGPFAEVFSKACHTFGRYYQVDKNIWVATPESCLLQLAADHPFLALLELAFEFCGIYVIDPSGEHKGVGRRKHLCSTTSLRKLVRLGDAFPGAKRIRQVSQYVIDNSASPMESRCAIAFSLPYELGGFNLPSPHLNTELQLPSHMRESYKRSVCTVDLLFSESKLAVEYKGKAFHESEYSLASDTLREAALRSMGYDVFNLAFAQVSTLPALVETGRLLSKQLKRRFRPKSAMWGQRNEELHTQLFLADQRL